LREILPRLKQCENGSLSSSQNCPKDREKKS
jgi:hypothetical protein